MGEEFNLFIDEEVPASGIYLHTDEHLEFIDALKKSVLFSNEILNNNYAWKWLILALHAALQGACVCALRGYDSAGINILSDKKPKKLSGLSYREAMWKWLDVDSRNTPHPPYPDEELADFLTLFKRVKNEKELRLPFTFYQDSEINRDVKKLHSLRNDFIHFIPKGWSIKLSGMPRIVSSVTEVIGHLAIKHPSFAHHLTEENHRQIEQSLDGIRNNIAQWARQHDIQNGSRLSPG